MPLENHPKILFLSPYLNFLLFELNDKTFISLYLLYMNEGEPIEELAEQYREPEPEEPYREQELSEGFDCIFRPCFIDTTYWPILQNCICFAC